MKVALTARESSSTQPPPHSSVRSLLACAGARIYTFDCTPVQPVAYEQTEHFRLYRDLLDDPAAYC